MKNSAPAEQAVTIHEHPLPPRVQEPTFKSVLGTSGWAYIYVPHPRLRVCHPPTPRGGGGEPQCVTTT